MGLSQRELVVMSETQRNQIADLEAQVRQLEIDKRDLERKLATARRRMAEMRLGG